MLETSPEESELELPEPKTRTRAREISSTPLLICLRSDLSRNSLLRNPENNKHFNDYILTQNFDNLVGYQEYHYFYLVLDEFLFESFDEF